MHLVHPPTCRPCQVDATLARLTHPTVPIEIRNAADVGLAALDGALGRLACVEEQHGIDLTTAWATPTCETDEAAKAATPPGSQEPGSIFTGRDRSPETETRRYEEAHSVPALKGSDSDTTS
jgi:hypothetical protein